MSYKLKLQEVNDLFNELKKEYIIYAPKRFEKQGRYSDTDIIKYDEINSVEEIVFKEKSTYPAKEVITPISQTLYYFIENEFRESNMKSQKNILIFARPCDINAQKRQDNIYLKNGNFEDIFYKRVRDKVKFICMECTEGWDTCFCVSMNSNTVDDYSLAVRFNDDNLLFNLKDDSFSKYFEDKKKDEFELQFIKENKIKVEIPEIDNIEILNKLKTHKMWEEYNKRCIQCGSCTIACSTCTCFTTTDIVHDAESNIGERKEFKHLVM